jgi:hypothetical protein
VNERFTVVKTIFQATIREAFLANSESEEWAVAVLIDAGNLLRWFPSSFISNKPDVLRSCACHCPRPLHGVSYNLHHLGIGTISPCGALDLIEPPEQMADLWYLPPDEIRAIRENCLATSCAVSSILRHIGASSETSFTFQI